MMSVVMGDSSTGQTGGAYHLSYVSANGLILLGTTELFSVRNSLGLAPECYH